MRNIVKHQNINSSRSIVIIVPNGKVMGPCHSSAFFYLYLLPEKLNIEKMIYKIPSKRPTIEHTR